jgi:hypothetical protein
LPIRGRDKNRRIIVKTDTLSVTKADECWTKGRAITWQNSASSYCVSAATLCVSTDTTSHSDTAVTNGRRNELPNSRR